MRQKEKVSSQPAHLVYEQMIVHRSAHVWHPYSDGVIVYNMLWLLAKPRTENRPITELGTRRPAPNLAVKWETETCSLSPFVFWSSESTKKLMRGGEESCQTLHFISRSSSSSCFQGEMNFFFVSVSGDYFSQRYARNRKSKKAFYL